MVIINEFYSSNSPITTQNLGGCRLVLAVDKMADDHAGSLLINSIRSRRNCGRYLKP